MARRNVVVYDNYQRGEFGVIGAWKAPEGSFTANNMLVYRTGELGVRAGMVERTPAGVPVGVVVGYGNTPVPTKDAWFAIGNNMYTFDTLAGNNLLTATGSTAGTATTVFDSANIGTDVYVTAKGKTNSYRLRVNTGAGVPAAISTLTGSPSGRTIESYGDRLVIGDITGSLENRMRFSDPLDYFSWPALNFIDIGDGWLITGLRAQRQHLVITKQTGFYILTGVPGVNPVLRKISNDFGPLGALESIVGYNDVLYNWPIFGTQPAQFTGAKQHRLLHLSNHILASGAGDVFPPRNGVAPLTDTTYGAVYLDSTSNKTITDINGAHTYHTFGVNISGFSARYGGSGGLVPTTDGGSAGTSAKFYVWDTRLDRPGIEGSTHDRAGDASSTAVSGNVTFPEWWAESGAEVRVRAVVVDFRKWNTGASNNNHFDLRVDMLRRYNNTSPVASNTVSFDESPASSSSSGTIDRRIFGFGEQGIGNGFQVVMSDCRGIAIQRIEVVIDSEPVRV